MENAHNYLDVILRINLQKVLGDKKKRNSKNRGSSNRSQTVKKKNLSLKITFYRFFKCENNTIDQLNVTDKNVAFK